MTPGRSITFFEAQFQRQIAAAEFALNPFEKATLKFVSGRVLDLGSGLGNLSIEAARRGASVVAIDASPTAVERIRMAALQEKLPIEAIQADLETYSVKEEFDTIVAIGLLMFFRRGKALAMLSEIQQHVAPGGLAIINVLIEGTTYLGMFEPGNYCLFARNELDERFASWEILLSQHDSFDAANNTKKEFATIVARKPLEVRPSPRERGL